MPSGRAGQRGVTCVQGHTVLAGAGTGVGERGGRTVSAALRLGCGHVGKPLRPPETPSPPLQKADSAAPRGVAGINWAARDTEQAGLHRDLAESDLILNKQV